MCRILHVYGYQFTSIWQDLQIRAIIVTITAGLWWIGVLYMLTILAAFSRNITPVLGGADKTSWIFNSFNVVTIILAPIFSFLSDVYGRVRSSCACLGFWPA
jgi:MFS family permease